MKEYAKKNIPEATIPWIKIKIEAEEKLLNDFKVKINTSSVIWLMDEKAIKDLWSDWSKQKIALSILPSKRKNKRKFSSKGENNILKR